MSFALNNATVGSTPTVFSCAGSVKIQLLINNAAVLVTPTFRDIAGNDTTGAQIFLAPGFYSLRRPVDSLSIVEAVAGTPAQVTIEALLLREANQ